MIQQTRTLTPTDRGGEDAIALWLHQASGPPEGVTDPERAINHCDNG